MFKSVLVVCVGNICRSPVGERILASKLAAKGSAVVVTSAGIGALAGHAADETASEIASENGVSLDGHIARQLTRAIGQAHDLIVVMEPGHKQEIARTMPDLSGRVMLFDQWTGAKGIADPYRQSRRFHEEIHAKISAAAEAWCTRLK